MPDPQAEVREPSRIAHPGFMPAGVDLRAILARTTPAELYVLLALIASAEPTGRPGIMETDRTAAEIAEAFAMSRPTIDRAINGNAATGSRGLTASGFIADAGPSGRRALRRITLPLDGQTPNTTPLKTEPTLHNLHYRTLRVGDFRRRSTIRQPAPQPGNESMPHGDDALILTGEPLSIGEVLSVARSDRPVRLGPGAIDRLRVSREVVERSLGDGQAHYGINTGFGSLSKQRIADADLRELQRNLVRSHAAGVGQPLGREIVRAMMLLLAASLARGFSGVRPALVEHLLAILNAGVTPLAPEIGSVGASGDLAPLAHIALVLIGEGSVLGPDGRAQPAAEGLRAARLQAAHLEAKEGLALINGTHLMAARAALLCADFDGLLRAAEIAAAMSIDACRGTDAFLDERVHAARNQPGPAAAAARLRSLLHGSEIIPSHVENDPRVQDPYSLRCVPAVLGAAADAAAYVRSAVERELGAVTDNPLVFASAGAHGPIVSAGNFHGMPLAIPLDVLTIAISHVAGIAERRIFFMLSASEPESQLSPYLSPRPGLHSGLMIAQYTAAACCNEIATLAMPASVFNLPTSAGIEDYNSFGPRSAAKADRSMELARSVIAVELICAAEGLSRHRPLRSGAGVERAYDAVRRDIPRYTADRPPGPDIEIIARRIAEGAFS